MLLVCGMSEWEEYRAALIKEKEKEIEKSPQQETSTQERKAAKPHKPFKEMTGREYMEWCDGNRI